MDAAHLRAETLRRFERWELQANEHLPLIESERELHARSSVDVARRAVAACYVAGLCYGADAPKTQKLLEEFNLCEFVAESERDLFSRPTLTDQQKAPIGWVVESIQFLAWSLGLVRLDHFSYCDDKLATLFPFRIDPDPFVQSARLRHRDEILQECDTLYMLHWSAVESELRGETTRIVLPVVSFRRHAADWVAGVESAWDDISLDT